MMIIVMGSKKCNHLRLQYWIYQQEPTKISLSKAKKKKKTVLDMVLPVRVV